MYLQEMEMGTAKHVIYTVVGMKHDSNSTTTRGDTFVEIVAGITPFDAAERAQVVHGGDDDDVEILAVFTGEHEDVLPETPAL